MRKIIIPDASATLSRNVSTATRSGSYKHIKSIGIHSKKSPCTRVNGFLIQLRYKKFRVKTEQMSAAFAAVINIRDTDAARPKPRHERKYKLMLAGQKRLGFSVCAIRYCGIMTSIKATVIAQKIRKKIWLVWPIGKSY